MEWECLLFFIWLIGFLIWGIYFDIWLARVIVSKWGDSIFKSKWGDSILKYIDRHSSSFIIRLLFINPYHSGYKKDKEYNECSDNKPISPSVIGKPVVKNSPDDEKGS